jgi:hypothetical protein
VIFPVKKVVFVGGMSSKVKEKANGNFKIDLKAKNFIL